MTGRFSFDPDIAFHHVRALTAGGCRLVGSAADAAAGHYILEQLRALGLAPYEQVFPVVTGETGECRFAIEDAPELLIEAAPMCLCPSTPPEGLTASTAWVGGRGEEPVGPGLAGRIVVWAVRSRSDFLMSYPRIAAQRPGAVIAVWPVAGIPPKHQQLPQVLAAKGSGVPTVCIGFEDGVRLWRERPERLHLLLVSRTWASQTSNIIVEIPGRTRPGEVILVGAHRDTAPVIPGAIDNASGVAVLLELARHFAEFPMDATLRIVAWGAEKAGMAGSLHAINKAAMNLDPLLATISIDGVGSWQASDQCYVAGSEDMTARIRAVLGELPVGVSVGYFGSDSEMFALHGVPGVSFGQAGPALSLLHTLADDLGMIDRSSLIRSAETVGTLVGAMGTAPDEWRTLRNVPVAVSSGIREILEASGWLD